MTINNHDKHLCWYDINESLSEESAKRYIAQLQEDCDLCYWELDSCDSPCELLVNIARQSRIENNLPACPSQAVLEDFAYSRVGGKDRVDIATHIASCASCEALMFNQGLAAEAEQQLTEQSLASAEKGFETIRQRKADAAESCFNNETQEPEQQLRIIDTAGNVVGKFDSEIVLIPWRDGTYLQSRIDSETLQCLSELPSWSIQVVRVREHAVVAEFTRVGHPVLVEAAVDDPVAQLVLRGIKAQVNAQGLTSEVFALAASQTRKNSVRKEIGSLRFTDEQGEVWTFQQEDAGNALLLKFRKTND